MKFVILTGMSGAGKSTALKMMEDIGFYCVDNLPIPLLEKFVELSDLQQNAELQKVAVGIDIRSGQALEELRSVLDRIKANGGAYDILFLDAEDSVLVKRYKETRRSHPLAGSERVDKGIAKERERLAFLKERASYIIDTSQLLTRELKAEIEKIFVQNQDYKNLFVTILSFGFKYGIPADSDLVFDVRFLPNPYYVEGLRAKTGNDKEIQDYVLQFKEAHEFLDKLGYDQLPDTKLHCSVDKGIAKERERLAFLKERASYIIDTSQLLTRELKAEIEKIFVQNQDYKNLFVTILSFGFKYGIPADSDLVFDVRFLPNPYYVEGLRAKTGNDKEIQDYVLQFKEAHEFLDKLEDMINFLIPNYIAEGKNQLVISIGCTGGKHRSVTLANELYKRMADKKEYGLKIEHRDIGKDALRGK